MPADNAALARRWMDEVWNQGRLETVYELTTANSVCHSESGDLIGPDDFIQKVFNPMRAVLSNVQVNVEQVLSEGDYTAVRWLASATCQPGGGAGAVQKRLSFRGVTWIRFENGKMMEGWDCWNQAGLQQALQTGVTPPSMMLV